MFAAGNAAAQFVDHFPQADAHGHFHQPGVVDGAGQRKELGPLALLGTDAGVPLGSVVDDLRDDDQGLDVVDVGRLAPQSALCGVGRSGPRLADAAFDGIQRRCLLTADEGPAPPGDLDVEIEPASQDVPAQQTVLPRLLDGQAKILQGQGEFVAYVEIPFVGTDGIGTDDHPL